jgi:uncharacterized sulfatase
MNSNKLLLIILSLITFSSGCENQEVAESPAKPNIIFILTDDLGYGDLGVTFQNQRKEENKPFHSTPQLDKMAEEGTLLTRHYVPAPVCAPSRASLLLGQHQGHAEIRNNQFDKALPDNYTMASVLKEAGYATAIIGKYGLQGLEGDNPATCEAYPTKRGFDYFFGYVWHRDGHNHYPAHKALERPPVKLYEQDQEISGQLEGAYTADLFTARAKKWIANQKQNNPDQPFFLYLAYDTPHAGLQVPSVPYPEGGGLNGGLQLIGEPGNYVNTVSDTIDNYIHPDYQNPEWPEVHQRFATMVRRIDDGVGDLLQLLKDLQIGDNTLIVFSSDNGPHHESYGYGEYRPTFFESFGNMDGTKRDVWEGGIRVPTVVWGPGIVSAGQQNSTPSQFHDWLPTFADLAGIPAPANTDGVSLVPLLEGSNERENGKVYIEYTVGGSTPEYPSFDASHAGQKRGEMQLIYLDGYKGVRYNISSNDDDFRIYDTEKDPKELNNLAGSSERFQELQAKMKSTVLQGRVSNASAPRPYDSIPVPALETEGNLSAGLNFKKFETETPWVPDVKTLQAEAVENGTLQGAFPGKVNLTSNSVVEWEGYLKVPETGMYNLILNSNGGLVMRLHDILLIDAGKKSPSGMQQTASIVLEQGLHPVKITFAALGAENPELNLQWSGPGFETRDLGTEELYH